MLVVFDEDGCQVLADGGLAGLTNRLFVLPTGAYTFSVAGEQGCAPSSQTVWVQHTRRDEPCVIAFVTPARVAALVAASLSQGTA
ncbi:MAG: hypothetical protein ACREJ0_19540 [Geminicoccaceae bacterium]